MASKNKLYIGNLSFDCSNEDLLDLFKQAGGVESADLITDKFTGRPRGFAFITMDTDEAAAQAIELFNDQEFLGRRLVVREAYDSTEKREFKGGPGGGQGGSRGPGGGGQGGERRQSNFGRDRKPFSGGPSRGGNRGR